MATRSDYLFASSRRRQPRRWHWLILLMMLLTAAAAAPLILSTPRPHAGVTLPGVGSELQWVKIGDLPEWAFAVVRDLHLGADYQFRATVVDLNRDDQQEIVIAPAPARPDLFVPEAPLRIVVFEHDRWQVDDADLSCRPDRLGSFLTNDWWDLSCRNAHGRHLLRFNGQGYRRSES
jgi:hypothetical protein